MPGRQFTAGSGYRYGFNGKENDNEVKGEGNQQDYGMRIYDSRLGRFLSVDPIGRSYPMLTPYQFASNTPVKAVDLDGLETSWIAPGQTVNYGAIGARTDASNQTANSQSRIQQQLQIIAINQRAQVAALSKSRAVLSSADTSPGANMMREGHRRQAAYEKEMAERAALDPVSYGGPGFGQGLVRDPLIQASAGSMAPRILAAVGAYGAYQGVKSGDYSMVAAGGLMMLGGKLPAGKTGTVWDDIVPTQPNYPGSVLPRSFELSTANGTRVWVHGNATEHIAENLSSTAKLYNPEYVRLTTQQHLRSLQAAVNSATESGIKYGEFMKIGGWELKFMKAEKAGQLPALV